MASNADKAQDTGAPQSTAVKSEQARTMSDTEDYDAASGITTKFNLDPALSLWCARKLSEKGFSFTPGHVGRHNLNYLHKLSHIFSNMGLKGNRWNSIASDCHFPMEVFEYTKVKFSSIVFDTIENAAAKLANRSDGTTVPNPTLATAAATPIPITPNPMPATTIPKPMPAMAILPQYKSKAQVGTNAPKPSQQPPSIGLNPEIIAKANMLMLQGQQEQLQNAFDLTHLTNYNYSHHSKSRMFPPTITFQQMFDRRLYMQENLEDLNSDVYQTKLDVDNEIQMESTLEKAPLKEAQLENIPYDDAAKLMQPITEPVMETDGHTAEPTKLPEAIALEEPMTENDELLREANPIKLTETEESFEAPKQLATARNTTEWFEAMGKWHATLEALPVLLPAEETQKCTEALDKCNEMLEDVEQPADFEAAEQQATMTSEDLYQNSFDLPQMEKCDELFKPWPMIIPVEDTPKLKVYIETIGALAKSTDGTTTVEQVTMDAVDSLKEDLAKITSELQQLQKENTEDPEKAVDSFKEDLDDQLQEQNAENLERDEEQHKETLEESEANEIYAMPEEIQCTSEDFVEEAKTAHEQTNENVEATAESTEAKAAPEQSYKSTYLPESLLKNKFGLPYKLQQANIAWRYQKSVEKHCRFYPHTKTSSKPDDMPRTYDFSSGIIRMPVSKVFFSSHPIRKNKLFNLTSLVIHMLDDEKRAEVEVLRKMSEAIGSSTHHSRQTLVLRVFNSSRNYADDSYNSAEQPQHAELPKIQLIPETSDFRNYFELDAESLQILKRFVRMDIHYEDYEHMYPYRRVTSSCLMPDARIKGYLAHVYDLRQPQNATSFHNNLHVGFYAAHMLLHEPKLLDRVLPNHGLPYDESQLAAAYKLLDKQQQLYALKSMYAVSLEVSGLMAYYMITGYLQMLLQRATDAQRSLLERGLLQARFAVTLLEHYMSCQKLDVLRDIISCKQLYDWSGRQEKYVNIVLDAAIVYAQERAELAARNCYVIRTPHIWSYMQYLDSMQVPDLQDDNQQLWTSKARHYKLPAKILPTHYYCPVTGCTAGLCTANFMSHLLLDHCSSLEELWIYDRMLLPFHKHCFAPEHLHPIGLMALLSRNSQAKLPRPQKLRNLELPSDKLYFAEHWPLLLMYTDFRSVPQHATEPGFTMYVFWLLSIDEFPPILGAGLEIFSQNRKLCNKAVIDVLPMSKFQGVEHMLEHYKHSYVAFREDVMKELTADYMQLIFIDVRYINKKNYDYRFSKNERFLEV